MKIQMPIQRRNSRKLKPLSLEKYPMNHHETNFYIVALRLPAHSFENSFENQHWTSRRQNIQRLTGKQ